MARNYSNASGPLAAGAGTAPRSGKRWWIGGGALAAIILLVVVVAVSCGGGDSNNAEDGAAETTTAGVGSAHGPHTITNGIPGGYTRDKAGAATAGVNFIQAVTQAGQGRISGEKLREQSVGTNPSEAVVEIIDQVSERGQTENVYTTIPVMTTVPEFTQDKAVVSVWQVDTGQSQIGDQGKVGVQTLWSTTTVTLTWSGTDWKVADWGFEPGPNPADAAVPAADSPLAQKAVNGYYSFYVD